MTSTGLPSFHASPHARSPLEATGWTFVFSQVMKLMFFLDRNGKQGWAAAVRRECVALLVPAEQGLRRLLVLMARRLAPLPRRPSPAAPSPPVEAAASPAAQALKARRPAFRLTEPAAKARRTCASGPRPAAVSARTVPDEAAANRRVFRRLLALVDAQQSPERLALRLARRLQSAAAALPLAAPRRRDLAGLSPQDQRVVHDLDTVARAVPDTS